MRIRIIAASLMLKTRAPPSSIRGGGASWPEVGSASRQRCERGGKALNWFCTQPLSRYRKKLKLFGCRTPSVEVPGVAAYGTSYRLVRSGAQLAGRAVALLSNG